VQRANSGQPGTLVALTPMVYRAWRREEGSHWWTIVREMLSHDDNDPAHMGTSTREKEKLSPSDGAVFPTLLRTGNFMPFGQEP